MTSIGNGSFYNCSNLQSITVEPNNPNYVSKDGILFTKNFQILLRFPVKHEFSEYTIPRMVTSIGDSAFSEMY